MNMNSITLADGTKATRNSKTRTYTHALVLEHTAASTAIFSAPGHWSYPDVWDKGQQIVKSWHSSYSHAQKAHAKEGKSCAWGLDFESMSLLIVAVDS